MPNDIDRQLLSLIDDTMVFCQYLIEELSQQVVDIEQGLVGKDSIRKYLGTIHRTLKTMTKTFGTRVRIILKEYD